MAVPFSMNEVPRKQIFIDKAMFEPKLTAYKFSMEQKKKTKGFSSKFVIGVLHWTQSFGTRPAMGRSAVFKRNFHSFASSLHAAIIREVEGGSCWKITSFLCFQICQQTSSTMHSECFAGTDGGRSVPRFCSQCIHLWCIHCSQCIHVSKYNDGVGVIKRERGNLNEFYPYET